MPLNSGEWKRTVLWSAWVLNMLFNTVYIVMSFITCSKLVESFESLNSAFSNAAWRAPIAASSLGPVMVLLFNVLSCFILIKKSVNRNGPGFGYGFIVAWCFVMAFFCLLCGLILESFSTTVASYIKNDVPSFTSYSTSAYDATFYFAYFCAAFFVVFFICLVVFQGGISKQLGMFDTATDEKRKMELAAMQVGMQLAGQGGQPQTSGGGLTHNNVGPQI